MVSEIVKPNFKDLGFLVPDNGRAGSIPKTMIFVDSIDEAQRIAAYLCTRLLLRLQRREKEIIRTFLSNLEPSTRTDFLKNFWIGNTQIWICNECADMGLNLRDIARTVQWKIPEHCTVADLL